MKNFFKRIFSGPDVVADTVKSISSGIGKMVFTEQEKTEANIKLTELFIRLQEATSGQNLARRFIAFVVVGMWGFLILLAIFLYLCTLTEQAKFVFDVLKEVILTPYNIVIGFYFFTHFARGARSK